jgi:hypothetical protein
MNTSLQCPLERPTPPSSSKLSNIYALGCSRSRNITPRSAPPYPSRYASKLSSCTSEIMDAVNNTPAPHTNYIKSPTPDLSIPSIRSTGMSAHICANITHTTMKTKKKINKTTKTTTPSRNPTQNENDDLFTQHASQDDAKNKACLVVS